jgi:hypothetical protein
MPKDIYVKIWMMSFQVALKITETQFISIFVLSIILGEFLNSIIC